MSPWKDGLQKSFTVEGIIHESVVSSRGDLCRFDYDLSVSYSAVPAERVHTKWSIQSSSVDGRRGDPSSTNSATSSTRIISFIQGILANLSAKIRGLRRNLPVKVLFFLVGFYCTTAFATVIGQTGDWDILSAALTVLVVEGIEALTYKASLNLLERARSLITMLNYWKAGLSLGLFTR
ncbi:hypothetical protein MLD38_035344 [Melastoma candidum]|uniref:Uncharacterized protein n=1 Tax=Melastoma candidum TaxID=119954 RepID=A0ACB9LGF0_9MYRT|nr:hypothetical protein MLD38_035344 [Melastoma candidum]